MCSPCLGQTRRSAPTVVLNMTLSNYEDQRNLFVPFGLFVSIRDKAFLNYLETQPTAHSLSSTKYKDLRHAT